MSDRSEKNIKQALYMAVFNKLQGELSELEAKDFKKGGVDKRKSCGKMNTDGNSFVAALYKGGKVGG